MGATVRWPEGRWGETDAEYSNYVGGDDEQSDRERPNPYKFGCPREHIQYMARKTKEIFGEVLWRLSEAPIWAKNLTATMDPPIWSKRENARDLRATTQTAEGLEVMNLTGPIYDNHVKRNGTRRDQARKIALKVNNINIGNPPTEENIDISTNNFGGNRANLAELITNEIAGYINWNREAPMSNFPNTDPYDDYNPTELTRRREIAWMRFDLPNNHSLDSINLDVYMMEREQQGRGSGVPDHEDVTNDGINIYRLREKQRSYIFFAENDRNIMMDRELNRECRIFYVHIKQLGAEDYKGDRQKRRIWMTRNTEWPYNLPEHIATPEHRRYRQEEEMRERLEEEMRIAIDEDEERSKRIRRAGGTIEQQDRQQPVKVKLKSRKTGEIWDYTPPSAEANIQETRDQIILSQHITPLPPDPVMTEQQRWITTILNREAEEARRRGSSSSWDTTTWRQRGWGEWTGNRSWWYDYDTETDYSEGGDHDNEGNGWEGRSMHQIGGQRIGEASNPGPVYVTRGRAAREADGDRNNPQRHKVEEYRQTHQHGGYRIGEASHPGPNQDTETTTLNRPKHAFAGVRVGEASHPGPETIITEDKHMEHSEDEIDVKKNELNIAQRTQVPTFPEIDVGEPPAVTKEIKKRQQPNGRTMRPTFFSTHALSYGNNGTKLCACRICNTEIGADQLRLQKQVQSGGWNGYSHLGCIAKKANERTILDDPHKILQSENLASDARKFIDNLTNDEGLRGKRMETKTEPGNASMPTWEEIKTKPMSTTRLIPKSLEKKYNQLRAKIIHNCIGKQEGDPTLPIQDRMLPLTYKRRKINKKTKEEPKDEDTDDEEPGITHIEHAKWEETDKEKADYWWKALVIMDGVIMATPPPNKLGKKNTVQRIK